MGVERAVTRWYIQQQTLMNEIDELKTQITQVQQQGKPGQEPDERVRVIDQAETDILQRLTVAQEKLRLLGPCPKPMMG
jgi:hypothetical protein